MPSEEYERRIHASTEWDAAYESRTWSDRIPQISFPTGWSVKILPPFFFAIIRFMAYQRNGSVSVYLDGYSMLGYSDEAYWEIHPNDSGDTERFPMAETADLVSAIQRSLDRQNDIPHSPVPVTTLDRKIRDLENAEERAKASISKRHRVTRLDGVIDNLTDDDSHGDDHNG